VTQNTFKTTEGKKKREKKVGIVLTTARIYSTSQPAGKTRKYGEEGWERKRAIDSGKQPWRGERKSVCAGHTCH